MNHSKCLVVCFFALIYVLFAIPLHAGELPPGTEAKGKTISGTMSIVLLDVDDIEKGMVGVIVGNCSKIPFQIGPLYEPGGVFLTTEEEDFSQFFFPNPVADVCEPPLGYQGYAITGVKNWVKTTDAITAEVFLTPVVSTK